MSDDEESEKLSPEELAQAQAFAEKVDDLVAGAALPRLGDADERELLRNSGIILAAHHEAALDSERGASLIEEALGSAVPGAEADKSDHEIHSLDAARAKRRRKLTFAISAVVAAAAIAILWFRVPPDSEKSTDTAPIASITKLPLNEQSRASDALVGRIAPDESAMSSSRLDQIYGDRMGGYRSLRYRQLGGGQ